MSGYIGVGSLSSPQPLRGDPRNQHLVSGDEIMRRARSSLPNPPAGQQWIRVDGDWQLVSTVEATAVDEAPHGARDGLEALTVECCDAVTPADGSPPTIDLTPPPPPREHVVLPGDTLQGLCLRYKTTARKLKKVNPSLDVGNSSLRGVAALRIPGTGPAQPATAEVEIARVRAAVPALSTAEARFYLSVDATVEAAVAHARADAAWERGQGDWVPPVLSAEADRGVDAALASAEAFILQASQQEFQQATPAIAVPMADAVVVEAVPVAESSPALC